MGTNRGRHYVDLIPQMRELCQWSGVPWVVENGTTMQRSTIHHDYSFVGDTTAHAGEQKSRRSGLIIIGGAAAKTMRVGFKLRCQIASRHECTWRPGTTRPLDTSVALIPLM
ncbi:hypothetical protein [Streptomyces sp. NPDC002133]|uniref:hypothetical protein n=1 Tax=Streptomyces sp. NPDC002133 TaxID=3154409 RepID=UPI003323C53C